MKYTSTQILMALMNPILLILLIIRKLPIRFLFNLRMKIDGIDRPYYAYGLFQAAIEAKRIGLKSVSAIEFGVASGRGLLMLEKLAVEISKITNIDIKVYGFDLEAGLPAPTDYRDLGYIWKKGFYKMDYTSLKSKLNISTKLVLGDVSKTITSFIKNDLDPVGFIAFDLDYYSSTKAAFKLFDAPNLKLLPRIFCYFDDIIGPDEMIMCDYVGELLAINEFNNENIHKKIARINGLKHKRAIKATWNDMIFVMHNFTHPLYSKFIYHEEINKLDK